MRIGIFGSGDDLQCQALSERLRERGATPVLIEHGALHQGVGCAFEGTGSFYGDERIDDIGAFFLRYIPAAYAPYVEKDDELVLYDDWFNAYMHERERASFYVSWLLNLLESGARIVNPPQAASVLQYKPFQLHAMQRLGIPVPRTLITNDPARVRAFFEAVPEVIYKPVMGGAVTKLLDREALSRLELIREAPVIFQERAHGDDLRVMLVDGEIVSCVAIEVDALDFRDDETYASGNATYREVKLPKRVREMCRRAAERCNLSFAGIDIKHRGDAYVFLELNSSPIYLDVERKLGHPITARIAETLVRSAERLARSRRTPRTRRRARAE